MTTPTSGTRARRPDGKALKAAPDPAQPVETVNLPHAFNLDELEREGRPEPFSFIHNGRQYVLADPQDQDWQQLFVVLGNPVLFLRLVMNDQDRDSFFENSMPAWKLNALTKAYREHYGLPELGESSGLSV